MTCHDSHTDLSQSASQDTESPPNSWPNLTINHLPDEILLVIFDLYRQGVDSYDHQWREKYVWFNLTHVCRRWHAVVFASSSRLDLSITVGPIKPEHIETILSSPLPILIDYKCMYQDMTSSALWRMRTSLEQRARVRGISFEGSIGQFNELFIATNCNFPILESLVLRCEYHKELDLPDTFLGGPDLSNLHLRCLKLERVSLTSVSRFLLFTSSITDLSLRIETAFGTSPETPLLPCLQGMPCLSRLELSISHRSPSPQFAPNDIVPLSKLACFHYAGHSVFLDAIVAGISAPSLRDFTMTFIDRILLPLANLTRFIAETAEHHRGVHVTFHEEIFRLSLLTQSNFIHRTPISIQSRIPRWSPEAILRMSGSLSTKLTTVEELCVTFAFAEMSTEDYILWRQFYKLFPSVKVLHWDGANYDCIAYTLLQDHEEPNDVPALFPALEEIEIGDGDYWTSQTRSESQLACFQPFISARERAGHPVKVFFRSEAVQTQMDSLWVFRI